MITELEEDLKDVPDTKEGWKAYALRMRSVLKAEKFISAKLRISNQVLSQRLYGRSSEKLNDAQRELFGLNGDLAQPLSDEAIDLMREARKGVKDRGSEEPKRRRGGRKKNPFENLPQVVTLIRPPEDQREGMQWIDQEVTQHVEIEPANAYVHIIVRPIYADPKHKRPPLIGPLPPEAQVFPGSRYGLSFMIDVILGKFADHLPLYRQEGIGARRGVWIDRQARNRIVDNVAHLLITIADQQKWKILYSKYLQIDETVTKVKDPERRGRSHDAYFWGFLSPTERCVYFEFRKKRVEKTLFEFFPTGWRGDVQTDGLDLYARAFKDMPFVRHFECLAHLRRYVLKAMESNEVEFKPILKIILALYRVERRARDLKLTHEQRGGFRHRHAKPLLKSLQKAFWELRWDEAKYCKLEGAALDAVTYVCGNDKGGAGLKPRWRRLALYAKCENGHIHCDQNDIENRFRPTKLGARNWLFVGHPDAGWRHAVLYSVLGTCKLLNVNPEAYLYWVLPQLATGTNKTTAKGLLPHDFAALFPEHVFNPHDRH